MTLGKQRRWQSKRYEEGIFEDNVEKTKRNNFTRIYRFISDNNIYIDSITDRGYANFLRMWKLYDVESGHLCYRKTSDIVIFSTEKRRTILKTVHSRTD